MIGHDVVNAALAGMNLLFETFSRKGRKMPRLSIKVSDKNLIKVASLNGKRQHWCSYWIVPAIPKEGPFPVPAGFRFSVDKDNHFFVENEAGDHKIQLFEGDYLILIAPSIRDLLAEPAETETRIWLSKGVFVCGKSYFSAYWEPAEQDDKSIPALIAKGTLIDTPTELPSNDEPSKVETQRPDLVWHPIENSVFDSESSAQSHPDFKVFDHIVINQKNPSNRHLHQMEQLLRQQGRAVIDTLNPSKTDLDVTAEFLRKHDYVVYPPDQQDAYWETVIRSLRARGYEVRTTQAVMMQRDSDYETGYAKGLSEGRQQVSTSRFYKHDLALKAYEAGFDAGHILAIISEGLEDDRTETESTPTSDSTTEDVRSSEKIARHGSNFRSGIEGFRESIARSHSAALWASTGEPYATNSRQQTGSKVSSTDGDSSSERYENEKEDVKASDSEG